MSLWRVRDTLFFRGLRKDDSGGTLIEYTVLLSLIAVSVVVLISEIGGKVGNNWSTLKSTLELDEGFGDEEGWDDPEPEPEQVAGNNGRGRPSAPGIRRSSTAIDAISSGQGN